jgi:hypothetical protein
MAIHRDVLEKDWFANVLLYSEVATLAGPYSDFASIGGAALDMVASARGITLSGRRPQPHSPGHADTSGTSRCPGTVFRPCEMQGSGSSR